MEVIPNKQRYVGADYWSLQSWRWVSMSQTAKKLLNEGWQGVIILMKYIPD